MGALGNLVGMRAFERRKPADWQRARLAFGAHYLLRSPLLHTEAQSPSDSEGRHRGTGRRDEEGRALA
jgi:hypothetical protein